METVPGLEPGSSGEEAGVSGDSSEPSGRREPGARDGARGRRILVADDNEDCRMALRALLEARGYEVYEAADGNEAVEVSRQVHPDLVLMDIMMPVVDGLEATRAIRATSGLDDVWIVAVSAMEGARQASLAAGCDECILKPIDLGGLEDMVGGWLDEA